VEFNELINTAATEKHNKDPFTVSEISLIIKQLIENSFQSIEIKGEISGVKRASSGHIYFSLKDSNAVINAICWHGTSLKLPIQIEDGLEVICSGELTSYPMRSNYQIIIKNIKLAGQGVLLELLEKRKKQLAAEGLFSVERKKTIPKIPLRIGIITSAQGAVLQDIIHRIKERFPVNILLWDVIVQGNQAAPLIAEAITKFNNLPSSISAPDVIIVARGGGSIEDLWAFNEEIVARATASSNIPIISAIGHETDTTIIDLVADLRAPTPTAAAELATPVITDLTSNINKAKSNLQKLLLNYYRLKKIYLENVLKKLSQENLMFKKLEFQLQNNKEKINKTLLQLLKFNKFRYSSLKLNPEILQKTYNSGNTKLKEYNKNYYKLWHNFYNDKKHSLHNCSKILNSYSYKNVLRRGYAIIRSVNGKLIKSSKDPKFCNQIECEFHDGKISGLLTNHATKKRKKQLQKEKQNHSLF
jgi:exodeoxyribonuclease VII large subunit